MKLTVAYSPCPNDTFAFHGVASGGLRLPNADLEVHLHDIETLNELALAGTYDITKLSFPAFLRVQHDYQMLRVGAALSDHAGPLVVTSLPSSSSSSSSPSSSSSTSPASSPACGFAGSSVPSLRFAIPGELTTAHLLLKLWCPTIRHKLFVPYDRIIPMIVSGAADAGVVIHESRFTYPQAGLNLLADLGAWWLDKTHLPIPLACIAARRSLGDQTIAAFETLLRESIASTQADPAAAADYIRRHAQEMDPDVLDQHIRTYVNRFSLDMGVEGLAAVDTLTRLAGQGEGQP